MFQKLDVTKLKIKPGMSIYKLASTYFTLFYRSVHVLYTGIYITNI